MRGWFAGRAVLVTGAGSGIGRASSLRFSREGGRVAVVDIDLSAAHEVAEEIVGAGGEAVAVQADIGKSDEISAMVEKVAMAFGRLDVAFNHAGQRARANRSSSSPKRIGSVRLR